MWLSMPQAICIAHPSSQDVDPLLVSGFDFFVTFFGRVLSFPTLFKDVFIFPHLFCRMFYFAAPFFGNVFFFHCFSCQDLLITAEEKLRGLLEVPQDWDPM